MSSENSDTREKILQACWQLLDRGEASAARMSDIARRAGVSRQAVYLHFPSRAELLTATTRYLDEVKDVDSRLAASRAAGSGRERLTLFIEAWGNYIPEIYGVSRALRAMQDSDDAARSAWEDRMAAVRDGCSAAVKALKRDGDLAPEHSVGEATDILWMLLSVENWERLTVSCGWSQARYVRALTRLATESLVGR